MAPNLLKPVSFSLIRRAGPFSRVLGQARWAYDFMGRYRPSRKCDWFAVRPIQQQSIMPSVMMN